jgi:hypothetical protein
MDHIQHQFYFYTHFWQIALILLAGACLDRLLLVSGTTLGRLKIVVSILIAAEVLILAAAGMGSPVFPGAAFSPEAVFRGGLLALVASGLVLQIMLGKPMTRSLCPWLLVAICGTDLSRYFQEASEADQIFTRARLRPHVAYPLQPEVIAALRQPWPVGDPSRGFEAGIPERLPIHTELWPDNWFMMPACLLPLKASGNADKRSLLEIAPEAVRFFAAQAETGADTEALARFTTEQDRFFDSVLLQSAVAKAPLDSKVADAKNQTQTGGTREITKELIHWSYNDLTLTVAAPAPGWLILHQLYDRHWQVSMDGLKVPVRQANLLRMAIPVSPGRHVVKLSYRPLTRILFWPACWLLELTLLVLAAAAVWNPTPAPWLNIPPGARPSHPS